MMRTVLVAGLLVSSVLAGGSCPAPPSQPRSKNGNFKNGPGAGNVGNAITHTWSRLSPEELSSSLADLATKTPGAVTSVTSAVGGYCSSVITPPKYVTTIPQTPVYTTSSASAAASSTSGAASSAAPTTLSTATYSSMTFSSKKGSNYTTTFSKHHLSSLSSTGSSSMSASASSTSSSQHSSTTAKASSSSKTSSTSTSSTTTTTSSSGCASPTAVLEWRQLSGQQQQALADANLCLMLAPPRANLPGAQSRWDELVAIHQTLAGSVHGTGIFLTWHRQFLNVYESELRGYCKYSGPMAFWDETLDAGDFHSAPMLTAQYYGVSQQGNAQCITNGVYGGMIEHIGPGSSDTDHCLSRGISESLSSAVTNSFVNQCNSYSDYASMEQCSYLGPHAYTHDAIGGVMSDVATSPGDPLFFLHHYFVDRNFRNWQLVDPQQRTYAIGGYTTQSCMSSNGGAGCVKTTLNDVLTTLNYYPSVTVAQVSNTQGGLLCYYYSY